MARSSPIKVVEFQRVFVVHSVDSHRLGSCSNDLESRVKAVVTLGLQ